MSAESIRAGFERYRDLLIRKPSIGVGTYVSRTRVVDGLTCEVSEGTFRHLVPGEIVVASARIG